MKKPRGTCYWALSAAAAIIETTNDPDQVDPPVLTVAALERLVVWSATDVPHARSKLADTTRPSVPTLTAEIGTVVPYTLPWAWADAFDADGRRGLIYHSRLGMDESVALFGDAGNDLGTPATPQSALEYHDALPLDSAPAWAQSATSIRCRERRHRSQPLRTRAPKKIGTCW